MEKLLIRAEFVRPTQWDRLNGNKLMGIYSAFWAGQERSLPPVGLIYIPQEREIVTWDGHHRLSIASMEEKAIPAYLYFEGDFIEGPWGFGEVEVDRDMLASKRRRRELAATAGIVTFRDLYLSSHKDTIKRLKILGLTFPN